MYLGCVQDRLLIFYSYSVCSFQLLIIRSASRSIRFTALPHYFYKLHHIVKKVSSKINSILKIVDNSVILTNDINSNRVSLSYREKSVVNPINLPTWDGFFQSMYFKRSLIKNYPQKLNIFQKHASEIKLILTIF